MYKIRTTKQVNVFKTSRSFFTKLPSIFSPTNQTHPNFLQSQFTKMVTSLLLLSILIILYQSQSHMSEPQEIKKSYSVWAIPPDHITERLKKIMLHLRSEFSSPEFEPHITLVGAIELTESDAVKKFKSACEEVKSYNVAVTSVSTGTFRYQCVFLLLNPSPQVLETSANCSQHFGYLRSTSYMPHASLLYADLTEEDKQIAKEKAEAIDAGISGLSFQISRLALYETDTEDKTLKSWKKIADCELV